MNPTPAETPEDAKEGVLSAMAVLALHEVYSPDIDIDRSENSTVQVFKTPACTTKTWTPLTKDS